MTVRFVGFLFTRYPRMFWRNLVHKPYGVIKCPLGGGKTGVSFRNRPCIFVRFVIFVIPTWRLNILQILNHKPYGVFKSPILGYCTSPSILMAQLPPARRSVFNSDKRNEQILKFPALNLMRSLFCDGLLVYILIWCDLLVWSTSYPNTITFNINVFTGYLMLLFVLLGKIIFFNAKCQ